MKLDKIEAAQAAEGMRWWNSLTVDQRRYEQNRAAALLGVRPSDLSAARVWEVWKTETAKGAATRARRI